MKKILSVATFLLAVLISIAAFAASPPGPHAIILPELCIQCGKCVDSCDKGAIKKGDPITIDVESCDGCGTCMDDCPTGAIWLEEYGR